MDIRYLAMTVAILTSSWEDAEFHEPLAVLAGTIEYVPPYTYTRINGKSAQRSAKRSPGKRRKTISSDENDGIRGTAKMQ
jgi:hypothetical protein